MSDFGRNFRRNEDTGRLYRLRYSLRAFAYEDMVSVTKPGNEADTVYTVEVGKGTVVLFLGLETLKHFGAAWVYLHENKRWVSLGVSEATIERVEL